jgi:hypothetical protein
VGVHPRRLYKRRWPVLFIFSALSFINRVVCFSYAPVADLADEYYHYPAVHLSWLIEIFFVTYMLTALPSAWMVRALPGGDRRLKAARAQVDKLGMRASMNICAWLQVWPAARGYARSRAPASCQAMGTGFRLLTIQHNESYSYDMARLPPAGRRGS